MWVHIPVRFALHWSEDGKIIVRERDDLGVLYVRAFQLEQATEEVSADSVPGS